MIEEYERPHHPPLCGGQDAPHLETTETPPSLINEEFEHSLTYDRLFTSENSAPLDRPHASAISRS
jgi:hypothetical protein